MPSALADIVDVPRLQNAIVVYLSKTWKDLKQAYPDEQFFYFGLYTANDALEGFADSAGGWKSAKSLAESLAKDAPFSGWEAEKVLSAAKWMCADHPYHCFGEDRGYGKEVDELLRPWKEFAFSDENADDELSDRLHQELRIQIDEALKRFKTEQSLEEVLILLTGGDIDWRWCAESAVRVNGEGFCRRVHPDLFEQY